MLRKGFTLLEILLTLAIIGALAAVLLKVITNAMPDAGKAKFLKAYSATRLTISDMINDSSLYPDTDETSSTYGFANTTQPFYGFYNDPEFSGDQKFAKIFADRLSLTYTNENQYVSKKEGIIYNIKKDDLKGYKIVICTNSSEECPKDDSSNVLGQIGVLNNGEIEECMFRGTACDMKALMDLRQGADEED